MNHDFANCRRGNTIAVFGLLELLNRDRLAPIGFDLRQEHKPVSSLTNFTDQIVLLQPFRAIGRTDVAVAATSTAITSVAHPSLPKSSKNSYTPKLS